MYREGSKIDTYILDMKANGGITGSKLTNPMDDELEPEEQMIKKEDFKVSREKRLGIYVIFLWVFQNLSPPLLRMRG